ncbi:hypothetical protein AB6E30_19385 [Vibrio sp. 10N.247.311.12]|uniref:hypothetical protein n=1 Tax=Vibrio sp. 10N.247.311.12 TaxID=3229991 RepID=UPI00354E8A29
MATIFQDPMTITFSLIIVVIALLAAKNLHAATKGLLTQLNEVNTTLKGLTHQHEYDDEGELIETNWEPNSTTIAYQNYNKMSNAIVSANCLKSPWEEFQRSMQLPNKDYVLDGDEAPALRNTIQVKSLFDISNIVEPYLNVRLYTSAPNILTGLGLLFTFVGLMIGIGEASVGLSSSDIDDAKQSLNPLLSGASIAFTTSVVGLLLSMIFSVFEKVQFYKLEKAVKEFSDYLATHIDIVDADKLAAMQLHATESQTKALSDFQLDQQRITDETITRVSKEFRETLLQSAGSEIKELGSLLSEMNEKLESNITRFTDSQERMQSVTESLTASIEESFGKVTSQLVESVNSMGAREGERVQQVIDSFREVMSEIESAHQSSSEQIQRSAEQATASTFAQVEKLSSEALPSMISGISATLEHSLDGMLGKVQAADSSMNNLVDQFYKTIEMQRVMTKEVSGNIEVMGRLQSQSNGSLEHVSNMLGQLNESSNKLLDANSKASETAQLYSMTLDSVNSATNKNIENAQAMNIAMKSIKEAISQQTSQSAEFEGRLNNVFEGLKGGLSDYAAQANTHLKSLDYYSAEVTGNLVTATNELRSTVEDIAALRVKEAV